MFEAVNPNLLFHFTDKKVNQSIRNYFFSCSLMGLWEFISCSFTVSSSYFLIHLNLLCEKMKNALFISVSCVFHWLPSDFFHPYTASFLMCVCVCLSLYQYWEGALPQGRATCCVTPVKLYTHMHWLTRLVSLQKFALLLAGETETDRHTHHTDTQTCKHTQLLHSWWTRGWQKNIFSREIKSQALQLSIP